MATLQIAEGKTKILSETDTPGEVRVTFKDAATAFNGEKFAQIEGKGALNASISALLFDLLERHGVPTCFVKTGTGKAELVYKKLSMIPLEVVVRNAAYGSIKKRFDLTEGQVFDAPIVEFYYKNDALGDPQLIEPTIEALHLLPPGVTVARLVEEALWANVVLVRFFRTLGILCADFKLEFGVDASGNLMLGDELSPDNFRFRDIQTAQVLDKDVFRFDLGDLKTAYETLHERLQEKLQQSPVVDVTSRFEAVVTVFPRKNVLNPEAKAVLEAIHSQGHTGIDALGMGKRFAFELTAASRREALQQVQTLAQDLFSNPVIEDVSCCLTLLEVP